MRDVLRVDHQLLAAPEALLGALEAGHVARHGEVPYGAVTDQQGRYGAGVPAARSSGTERAPFGTHRRAFDEDLLRGSSGCALGLFRQDVPDLGASFASPRPARRCVGKQEAPAAVCNENQITAGLERESDAGKVRGEERSSVVIALELSDVHVGAACHEPASE